MTDRSYDIVRGKFAEVNSVKAEDARQVAGLCGPEALLYEPKYLGLAPTIIETVASFKPLAQYVLMVTGGFTLFVLFGLLVGR